MSDNSFGPDGELLCDHGKNIRAKCDECFKPAENAPRECDIADECKGMYQTAKENWRENVELKKQLAQAQAEVERLKSQVGFSSIDPIPLIKELDALKAELERLKRLDVDYGKLYAEHTSLINSTTVKANENLQAKAAALEIEVNRHKKNNGKLLNRLLRNKVAYESVYETMASKLDTMSTAKQAYERALRSLLSAWDRRHVTCGETETSVEFRELLKKAGQTLEEWRGK